MSASAAVDSAALLREAIAITGHMLEAAMRGDWDGVVGLERERAPLIAICAGISSELKGLLTDLHSLNIELEDLTAKARTATMFAIEKARRNGIALDAYQQNGRG